MKKTKQNKEFQIQAELKILTSVNIKADSLEDARVKAKQMSAYDFVDFKDGGYIDGSHRIVGAFDNESGID